jgi:CheY-like chemotaxis protein
LSFGKSREVRLSTSAPAMRPTVLIVDDDPDVMDVTTELFDGLGYDVLSADCPRAALEVLRTMGESVRLLFTDIVMPEMGGREFAAEACALCPNLKILYTSGQPHTWAGIEFIPKPYTSALLADAIERALA